MEWPWSHTQDNYLPKSMVEPLTNVIIKTTQHAWVPLPISIRSFLTSLGSWCWNCNYLFLVILAKTMLICLLLLFLSWKLMWLMAIPSVSNDDSSPELVQQAEWPTRSPLVGFSYQEFKHLHTEGPTNIWAATGP